MVGLNNRLKNLLDRFKKLRSRGLSHDWIIKNTIPKCELENKFEYYLWAGFFLRKIDVIKNYERDEAIIRRPNTRLLAEEVHRIFE